MQPGHNRIVYVPRPVSSPAASALPVGSSMVSSRPAAAPLSSSSSDSEMDCLTCVQPMDYVSVGACNHRHVCPSCTLKMRKMLKKTECILCKANLDVVIFTNEKERDFSNFDTSSMVRMQNCGVYFDDKVIEDRCRDLLAKKCPKCAIKPFKDLTQLRAHLKDAHGLYYCTVCLKHEKNYLSEQKLYNKREHDDHLKGSKGHPFCQFCNTHFYDSDALYYHCENQHNSCTLCAKSVNAQQYFRDVDDLVDHFREAHYICEDPLCIARTKAGEHLGAFREALDLTAHQLEMHSERGPGAKAKKIKINIPVGISNSSTSSKEREASYGGGGGGKNFKKRGKGAGGGGGGGDFHSHIEQQNVQIHGPSGPASSSSSSSAPVVITAPPGHPSNSSSSGGGPKYAKKKPSGQLAPLDKQVKSNYKIIDLPQLSEEQVKQRNKEMVAKMRTILGKDRFQDFKAYCAHFYTGLIDAKTFHDIFIDSFGSEGLALFDESTVLLPDKEKQSQLLAFLLEKCPTTSSLVVPSSSSSSSSSSLSIEDLPAKTQSKATISGPKKTSSPSSSSSSSVPVSSSSSAIPSLPVPSNDVASFPPLSGGGRTSVAVSASSAPAVVVRAAEPPPPRSLEQEFPSLPTVSVGKKAPTMSYSDTTNRKALISNTADVPVEQAFPALPVKAAPPTSVPSWGPGSQPKRKNRTGGTRYRL